MEDTEPTTQEELFEAIKKAVRSVVSSSLEEFKEDVRRSLEPLEARINEIDRDLDDHCHPGKYTE